MIFSRRILILLFLGFASGLPIALTTSTLTAWYTESGVSLANIGLLTLIGQPYVYKFLWAPLLDRYDLLKLGRRRSWMILTQIILAALLFVMCTLNPAKHGLLLALVAFLVAIFSSTQDTAVSGYLTEAPLPNERGIAVSFFNTSYRLAMIFSSAVALIIAQYYGWHITYLTMAITMLLFIIASFMTPEPTTKSRKTSLRTTFIEPFAELLQRFGLKTLFIILLLMLLYKMTDAFALSLSSVFFLRELQYSLAEMGMVNKIFGTVAGILGGLTAGFFMQRLKLFPALVIFGLAQAFANLTFVWLYLDTHTVTHFAIAVIIDNFASGLGSTAFLAMIMSLCNREFAGTQFALLSAITAFGRVYMGPPAAWVVDHFGWVNFFLLSIVIGVVAVALLFTMKPLIYRSSLTQS